MLNVCVQTSVDDFRAINLGYISDFLVDNPDEVEIAVGMLEEEEERQRCCLDDIKKMIMGGYDERN